jgi:hypothetical protein
MRNHQIYIDRRQYHDLRTHLFGGHYEQVAFLFAEHKEERSEAKFYVRRMRMMSPADLDFQSVYHISLTDDALASVIKEAWETGTVPIEVHSHLSADFAPGFSKSDYRGFEATVPHVRWRLQGKPYAALVFCPSGFDGLVWRGGGNHVEALDALIVGEQVRRPSRHSIEQLQGNEHD